MSRVSGEHASPVGLSAASARVSVVVPTYREAANIPHLIEQLDQVRRANALDLELLIMDDDSRDGTVEAVAQADKPWVKLHVRTHHRGLSPAVLEGLERATGDTLLVMDGDLSHPPQAIPALLAALDAGHDFVIGSRYVDQGGTDDDWGLLRQLNSRFATLLARPFTTVRDPMAGFFALRRATLARAPFLNPIGYKIGLELLVKCACENVGEVPILFQQRARGSSKLNVREQLRYLQHLRRLALFKYPNASYIAQFLVVGSLGLLVNLAVLTLLLWVYLPTSIAFLGGIVVSVIFNFLLHRRFTFSYAKSGPILTQFIHYVAATSFGMGLNFAVAWGMHWRWPWIWPQIAAAAGVACGMVINFVNSRYLVFRKARAGV